MAANVRRLVECGMVPALAKQVAAVIDAGVVTNSAVSRLAEAGMIPRHIRELRNQIAGTKSSKRWVELGVSPRLAVELANQTDNGGIAQKARMKSALATGAPRQVMASDPITVGTFTAASSITSPVSIAKDDARIRLLGRWQVGTVFPATQFLYPHMTSNGPPTPLSGNGIPANWGASACSNEVTLPAGDTVLEYLTLGAGGAGNLIVEIDGVSTNDVGYPMGPGNTGSAQYYLMTFPVSASPRRIRITTTYRPFGGFRLPTGKTLGPLPTAPIASAVYLGDSITQQPNATHPVKAWPYQSAYRLGIGYPVVSGVGGSGYLRRLPTDTGYNFRERITDVVEGVNGGPPDAVFVAGAINDTGVVPGDITPAQLGAEALLYYKALRAAAPDMLIFVVGPWSDYNNAAAYSATSTASRDALFAAAAQVSRTYTIDISTVLNSGNREAFFPGGAGNPHPTDVGHAAYGEAVAARAATYIAGF